MHIQSRDFIAYEEEYLLSPPVVRANFARQMDVIQQPVLIDFQIAMRHG